MKSNSLRQGQLRLNRDSPFSKGLVLFLPLTGFNTFDRVSGLTFSPGNAVVSPVMTQYGPAAKFANSPSAYLIGSGTPLTTLPITISCWFYPTQVAATRTLISITNTGNTTDFHSLDQAAAAGMRARSGDSGGASNATTTPTVTTNTWQHGCATFASATSRSVFLNGQSKATGSSSRTPSGLNRFNLGALAGSSVSQACDAYILMACAWNRILSDGEVAYLGDIAHILELCDFSAQTWTLGKYPPIQVEEDISASKSMNVSLLNLEGALENQAFAGSKAVSLSEKAGSLVSLSENIALVFLTEDISEILDSIALAESVSITLDSLAGIAEVFSSTRTLVITESELARSLDDRSFDRTQGLSPSVIARVIQSLSAGKSSSIVPSSVVNVPKSLAIASGHAITLTDGRLYSDDVNLPKTIGLLYAYVYGAGESIQIGKTGTISAGEAIAALISSGLSKTLVISPSMNGDYTLSVLLDKTASADFVPGTILYVFTTPRARIYMVIPENRSMVADEL